MSIKYIPYRHPSLFSHAHTYVHLQSSLWFGSNNSSPTKKKETKEKITNIVSCEQSALQFVCCENKIKISAQDHARPRQNK